MRCLTAYAEPFGDLALEEAEAERLSEPVESVLRQAVTRLGLSARVSPGAQDRAHDRRLGRQVVKVMDGLNRFRFARQPELLAAWASVSHVIATPRSTGDIRPAA